MFEGLVLFGQFFTKLNIPLAIDEPLEKFRRNIQYITLFGFILGALEGALVLGIGMIMPLWFAWLSYWMIDGLITGGFHLDALADTADGFFSSRTPDKIFAIMKDSRLGTMGSLALLYYYGLNFTLGLVLLPHLTVIQLTGLVALLTMLTKVGLSLQFYQMRYAGSPHGLSKIWLNVATWRIMVAQGIALGLIAWLTGWSGILGYSAVIVTAWWYRRKVYKVLDGFSGDTLGAFACLTQLVFLLVLTVVSQFGLPMGW